MLQPQNESAQRNSPIDPTRLRDLVRRLHALGGRPIHEYLREFIDGVVDRLGALARLDPALVAALSSFLTALDGGRV